MNVVHAWSATDRRQCPQTKMSTQFEESESDHGDRELSGNKTGQRNMMEWVAPEQAITCPHYVDTHSILPSAQERANMP